MNPERLSRKTIYESQWVNLYLDKVRFPNGIILDDFHLLDFPHAAVVMLAENADGALPFVQVFRYATGSMEWELPAGRMEEGESEIETARREVLEETGYSSSDHRLIYTFLPIDGIGNLVFHVVRCRALERVREYDHDEVSAVKWCRRDEVRQMVKERRVRDGLTLIALLLWLQD